MQQYKKGNRIKMETSKEELEKTMDLKRAWFVYQCHHNNRNYHCSVAHCHCWHDETRMKKIGVMKQK